MRHIWTYKLLPHLPAPPQRFLDSIDLDWRPDQDTVKDYSSGNNEARGEFLATAPVRNGISWYGRSYQGVTHRRRPLGDDWEAWVTDNISNQFSDTGISYADGALDRPTSAAHTDGSRDFSLIWSVDPGGSQAELAIWRAKDHPVLWDRHVCFTDTSDLVNLTVLPGNPGCWYLVNAKILHSVENLTRNRVGLQVSFLREPFQDCAATHVCYTW